MSKSPFANQKLQWGEQNDIYKGAKSQNSGNETLGFLLTG